MKQVQRCILAFALVFMGVARAPVAYGQNANPIVLLQTSKGPIYIRIFLVNVPNTAKNFLDLVQRGFYNGLTFHRVETWCIQGGDPLGNGNGNFIDPETRQPRFLRLEISSQYSHKRPGMVAMARSKSPDSASCQFYITKGSVPYLDGQYAIFGGVLRGMDTVMHITPGDRILSAQILESELPPGQQPAARQPGGRNVESESAPAPNPPSRSDSGSGF